MNTKKIRGKKYKASKKLIKNDAISIDQAIELIKKADYAKYKSSVEVKVNLNVDIKDSEQNVRFTCTIPHPFGEQKKVLVFGEFKEATFNTLKVIKGTEETIEKILTGKFNAKKDFDIVVCDASFMPKIAKAARILGPKGLMPNPKTNTVGELNKILPMLDKGQVEVRLQPSNKVVHLVIGKIKDTNENLVENYKTLLEEINKHKPSKVKKTFVQSVYIKSSQSPSIQIVL